MREKSSHKRRQKDCSSRPSGSTSGRASSSAEERAASIRGLVDQMEESFTATQERARVKVEEVLPTSEEELESLVGEAVRTARCKARTSPEWKASPW